MQLTLQSDYSLRALIYLAIKGEEQSTIEEIAKAYQISENHLTRIIHKLGELSYIKTTRGRGGGILLALHPSQINLGEVILKIESNFYTTECFDPNKNQCIISSKCLLKPLLQEATEGFLNVLKQKTLADIIKNKATLASILLK